MTWDRLLSEKLRKSELFMRAWDVIEKIDVKYRRYSTKIEKINNAFFVHAEEKYTFDAYVNYAGWVNVLLITPNGGTIAAFEI